MQKDGYNVKVESIILEISHNTYPIEIEQQ